MEFAFFPGKGVLEFCAAVFFLLACAQMVHLVVIRRAHDRRFWRLTMAYEILVAIHLTVSTFYMNALGHMWVPSFIAIGPLMVPLDVFLWFNVVIFACGLSLCIGVRRPSILPELVALLAMTPFVIDLAGTSFMVPVILDAVVFGFAITRRLLLDHERSFVNVMPSAVVTAMKAMPEGVLIASAGGRVLFVNDAMRGLLAHFGIRADLSGLSDILRVMREHAGALTTDGSMRVLVYREDMSLMQAWHVESDEALLGKQKCVRLLAIDITEESLLERELEEVSVQLEATEAQLVETLEEVRDAASDEALIRMRSRVHDVIGQRLSLLHRYLEDESIDDERLEKMKPMLKGIVSDLREDADVDWRIELESIVSAFLLVGVEVEVTGELPQDIEVAIACTGIIREAVTNAVKHANATSVHVIFERADEGLIMTIEDNGAGACAHEDTIVEGQGLKGMRMVVDRCGGRFDVVSAPSFILRVAFPTM